MFEIVGSERRGRWAARVLVAGEETGGRLAAVELRLPGEQASTRHIHAHEDELIYVLEGSLICDHGGGCVTVAAGNSLFLPRGNEHCVRAGAAGARLLVVITPAGLEGYYRESGAGEVASVEGLIATAARYGVAITGPGA